MLPLFLFTLLWSSIHKIFIYILYSTLLVENHSWYPHGFRSVEGSSGMPSRDSNSGLPYSKPTHYCLSYDAPFLSYAAPFWSKPHPDLSHAHPPELRRTPSELRVPNLSYAAPYLSYAAPCLSFAARYIWRVLSLCFFVFQTLDITKQLWRNSIIVKCKMTKKQKLAYSFLYLFVLFDINESTQWMH